MNTTDRDYQLALALQKQFDNETPTSPQQTYPTPKSTSVVDSSWETIDPNPNIHDLFIQFNEQYFYGKLSTVEVRWSPRMTLCAGLCHYQPRAGYCSVRLSEPLLKLRPRRDLIQTLLHEMIHAYLFVTHNNRDHDSHGPEFHKHMYRINKAAGCNITVYHTFHDEVDAYRQHWWRCDGVCQNQKPFFGLVKRAMNRAPSKNDTWWNRHQAMCGGTFHKIKEPENYKNKTSLKRKFDETSLNSSNKKPCKSPKKNGSTIGVKISNWFIKKNSPTKKENKDERKEPISINDNNDFKSKWSRALQGTSSSSFIKTNAGKQIGSHKSTSKTVKKRNIKSVSFGLGGTDKVIFSDDDGFSDDDKDIRKLPDIKPKKPNSSHLPSNSNRVPKIDIPHSSKSSSPWSPPKNNSITSSSSTSPSSIVKSPNAESNAVSSIKFNALNVDKDLCCKVPFFSTSQMKDDFSPYEDVLLCLS